MDQSTSQIHFLTNNSPHSSTLESITRTYYQNDDHNSDTSSSEPTSSGNNNMCKLENDSTNSSILTADFSTELSQYSVRNRNPYSNKPQQQKCDIVESLVSSCPALRSFDDTIQYNQQLQQMNTRANFLDRTTHSINPTVNLAFANHQKAFIRKNRARDYILSQPTVNIDTRKQQLYSQLQHHQDDIVEQTNAHDITLVNEAWGDQFPTEKLRNHTRLFFQNIRGLQTSKRNSQEKWGQLLEYVRLHHIDIAGFAESCTNTTRHRIRQQLQRTANSFFIQTNLCWAENDFVTDTNYRPGGTVTATTDSWVGRILFPLQDPHLMGRWSGNAYQLSGSQRLIVVTAYRVCKQSLQLGLISSYRQQMLKLQQRRPQDTTLCPRRYFVLDFVEYIQSLQITPDDFLMVMIDANEHLGEDVVGISNIMEKLGLIDTFTRHHQKACELSTHHTSSQKRIDFILSTANLLPHIELCGYTPFYESVDTDHRGLFIELKPSFIDGQARIAKQPIRLIGCTTSKAEVAKYKEYLLNSFNEADIPDRAEALYEKAKQKCFTSDDLKQLQKLDTEVTQLMLQAERDNCSAKPSFPWSPKMRRAALVIKYWTLRYRNRKANYDISSQLKDIYEQLTERQQQAIDNTKAGSRYNLHKAKIRKQVMQLQAITKRREMRSQRIEQEADFRETSVEHEQQRFAMIDETHHLFRYLEQIYGKKRSIGISSIEVPFQDQAGTLTNDPTKAHTWLRVQDPDEIVSHLIDRNIKHFGQAQGTDFTVSPIEDYFGYKGIGSPAKSLINHQAIPTSFSGNISDGAQHILAKLADGRHLSTISDDISLESFWKAFQVWDEKTSTSPSGRHLGHYKALIMADGQDMLYKKDEEGNAKKVNPSITLKRVHFHIALAATLSGNTLPRWCNSSTMMIEKIPGQPRIHKLRVIHIFEADYNLMLKLLWSRRLVWNAHKSQRLNEAQAGSRPDHRCIDVVLRKTMNYTYAILTRTPLITIDNDAKACYDRIPCNLAMLISKYYGMTAEGCAFHAKTLEAMKFRVRTAAGDSTESYSHTKETPIHGTGQGSCASPCLWLLISSSLMECHNDLAQGMVQLDVNPTSPIRTCGVEGFVDDVSVFINPDYSTQQFLPLIDIIGQLILSGKQDFEIWQMLLEAAGGKLELAKCFWYLLAWCFNRFGDPFPLSLDTIEELFSETISVTDKDTGNQISLEQKDVNEAHRTLGAYKCVTGDEEAQYKVLLEKSNKLAIATKTGQLSRFQARRAFSSIYVPSMTYSLVSTTLSQQSLKAIQSKAIQAFLPAMGYERTFPHAVVFASRCMGGLNLGDLYTECGIAKVIAVLEHIRADTGLGHIMKINLNWLQLQTGLSTPILESDVKNIPYISNNWFLHLKEFLTKANSTINIPSLWYPKLERERDCLLMDRIIQLNLPKRILRICNNWRLYFRVLTLSDITTADGKSIHDRYWKATEAIKLHRNNHRKSNLNWPVQLCPDRNTFSAWKQCINLAFNLRNQQQLPIGLGDWLVPPSQSSNQWEYYLQPYRNLLYKNCFDGSYEEYALDSSPTSRLSTTLKFNRISDDMVTELPSLTFPVSPREEYGTWRIKQAQATCCWAFPSAREKPRDFETHLETLPLWKQQILMHWESVSEGRLKQLFTQSNEILIATDGGFDQEKGTGSFGAVIADQFTTYATISGSAPGRPDLHCSFRSEMYGLLAACALLNEIMKFYHLDGKQQSTKLIFLS